MKTAMQVAKVIGLQFEASTFMGGSKFGNKALVGQYWRKEGGRRIDMAEQVNFARSKYISGNGFRNIPLTNR